MITIVLYPCQYFKISIWFLKKNFWCELFGCLDGKDSACNARRPGFNLWVGKIPWRRKWQPIPVFLPGKLHGWRSLAGYSPWGHKASDITKQLSLFIFKKSLWNLLQYCLWVFYGLVFFFFLFWPQGIWDLSSLTRDQMCTPFIGRWSLNQWTWGKSLVRLVCTDLLSILVSSEILFEIFYLHTFFVIYISMVMHPQPLTRRKRPITLKLPLYSSGCIQLFLTITDKFSISKFSPFSEYHINGIIDYIDNI